MAAKKKCAVANEPAVDIAVDPDPVDVVPPTDAKKPTKKPAKKTKKPVAKKLVRPIDEVSFREPVEVSSRKIMCLLPDLISLAHHIIDLGFRADEDEVLGNVNSMLRDVYLDEKKQLNAKNKGDRR